MGAWVFTTVASLCTGVLFGFLFPHALWAAGLCILLALAILLVSRRIEVLLVGMALAALCVGIVRSDLFLRQEMQHDLAAFVGNEPVAIIGVVRNDPERRETTLHAHVQVTSIGGVPAGGKLLALLPRDVEVLYGDNITIAGRLEEPQVFKTETGRVFDYPSYLRARGISGVVRYAELAERQYVGFSPLRELYSLKHSFIRSLERLFGEPSGSLLEGLLLGERRSLPTDLTQAFIAAGLIHIVVLSGYNISLVAEGVLRALSWLPRSAGLLSGSLAMLLFVVMIGGGAAAVRALIMALIAMLARYFGRSALALRALALAAAGMVLWNPVALMHDPSFILSMLATFGLITLAPAVESALPKFFSRLPSIRSIAASTIAVQLFVLPALLYMTGIVSLWALPANIVALPVVPFAMTLGFTAGVLGFIHPAVALPAVALTEVPLRLIVAVAQGAQALPLSGMVIETFPLWVALAAYLPLAALALYAYRMQQKLNEQPQEKKSVRKKAVPVDVKVHVRRDSSRRELQSAGGSLSRGR